MIDIVLIQGAFFRGKGGPRPEAIADFQELPAAQCRPFHQPAAIWIAGANEIQLGAVCGGRQRLAPAVLAA